MGYTGAYYVVFNTISPSIVIKFNVQSNEVNDIDYNTIGTVLNGAVDPLYPPYGYPIAETRLNNGIPWNVWVDYDGYYLTIHTTQSPQFDLSTQHTRRQISLQNVLTQTLNDDNSEPKVYIGFTSDPGANPAYHDILEWHFRPFYKPFGDYCGDPPDDRPESCGK